jgi:hypothetical protein
MRMSLRLLATALVMLLAVAAFGQGVYTEQSTTVKAAGDRTFPGKTYYMPKMMKSISNDRGIIVRLDKQMIYQFNTTDQTYSEMTFTEWDAQMKKASAQLDAKMEELKKHLESMPPEQRKMMEQMMGNKDKKSTYDIQNTGEKKTIDGFPTTKYVVLQDGKEFLTAWTTKDLKGFASMRKDYEEMTSRLAQSAPGGAAAMADAMKKLEGFPLEMDMAMGVQTVVTKVTTEPIPESEFQVPAGYKKIAPDLEMKER